jgi:DNA-binding transcriptional LysR family regulator
VTFDPKLFSDLCVFLTILRCGGMSRAAIDLGVTTSALSHRLRKLETSLGIRLLNRSSRSIRPTTAGAMLAGQLQQSFEAIAESVRALEQYRQFPAGKLRLNVLRDAARLVLKPVIRDYSLQFPNVHLDVTVDDHFVDIVGGGFDAGIRYGDRVPQDMVGVALTSPLNWVVVASPELIGRIGRPETPQQLLELPCIQMRVGDNSAFPWELGNADALVRLDVRGPLCANETEHSVGAAIQGVGFAYCLERRVASEVREGRLEVVLPQWASTGPCFMIYYPSRRQPPSGLRQLIDMIRSNERLAPVEWPRASGASPGSREAADNAPGVKQGGLIAAGARGKA